MTETSNDPTFILPFLFTVSLFESFLVTDSIYLAVVRILRNV